MVRFAPASSGMAQVRVLDLAGRVLQSRMVDVSAGGGLFEAAPEPLPSGLYFVQVVNGRDVLRAKAIVTR